MDECPGSLRCYEFGGFRLDATRRVINTSAGRRLAVPPKVFDAALYFVQHAGQTLSKQQLLAELWPGLVVEENGLTQVISILRRALGEARGDNRYIVTVPRRGYCFVATVLRVAAATEMPSIHSSTVAVLPFDNWSDLAADELLAAGIAECILHRLAGTAGIKLVAQTSSFALRGLRVDACEVGRRLDAGYLIEGSLQRAGARLRITAQLIDTTDGTHVWSQMFNVKADDVFAMEDYVSQRVARALRHSLIGPDEALGPVNAVGSIVARPAREPSRRNRLHR
jgi:TolB-like protein